MKALIMIAILLVAGTMEYQDEFDQEAHYCEMVTEGHWEAYNNNIKCEDDQ